MSHAADASRLARRVASGRNDNVRMIPAMHRVAVLALADVVAFDLATPFQVLGRALRALRRCAAVGAGPIPTTSGFSARCRPWARRARASRHRLVPGFDPRDHGWPPAAPRCERSGPPHAPRRAHRLDLHRRLRARPPPACSTAAAPPPTGATRSASRELLPGGRRSTPTCSTSTTGDVLTSAGVAAGIDLCLHLLRRDHGAAAANAVARQMVVAAAPRRRPGAVHRARRARRRDDGSLEATRAWALEHLDEPLTVAQLARHACTSERTFTRRFRAETGTTPLQLAARAARRRTRAGCWRSSDLPVETVAQRCGFGSAAILRQHFRRATATTPTAYRRDFRRERRTASPRRSPGTLSRWSSSGA